MTCNLEQIRRYLKNRLDRDEELPFLMHLDECSSCWNLVYQARKAEGAENYRGRNKPQPPAILENEKGNEMEGKVQAKTKTERVLEVVQDAGKPLTAKQAAEKSGVQENSAGAFLKQLYDRGLLARQMLDGRWAYSAVGAEPEISKPAPPALAIPEAGDYLDRIMKHYEEMEQKLEDQARSIEAKDEAIALLRKQLTQANEKLESQLEQVRTENKFVDWAKGKLGVV